MAVSTSCCLKLLPPPPSSVSYSSPSKTTHISWQKKESCWRGQHLLGVGCVIIIGFEMGNSLGYEENLAIAGEMKATSAVMESKKNVLRWSDKRSCPPWRVNSLETIVPENLPRPSTRRRWEAVGYSAVAPPVGLATKTSTMCFSL